VEAQRKVAKALDTWFDNISDFMPAEVLEELPRAETPPEKEILGLPSDFPYSARTRLGLDTLTKTELCLRIGQLHDALGKLRNALGLKSFLVRQKKRLASGQGPLLRSETEISRAGRQVQKWKVVYQRGWEALTRLREGSESFGMEIQLRPLRELRDEDCIMLSEWLDDHRLWRERGEIAEVEAREKGGGRRELPWFWKTQFENGEDTGMLLTTVQTWTEDGEWYIFTVSLY